MIGGLSWPCQIVHEGDFHKATQDYSIPKAACQTCLTKNPNFRCRMHFLSPCGCVRFWQSHAYGGCTGF